MITRLTAISAAASALMAVALLLPLPAPAAQENTSRILESGPARLVVEVTTSDWSLEKTSGIMGEYNRLRAPGLGYITEGGEPLLPIAGFLVGIPPQGRPTFRILEEEWTSLEAGLICPAPTPTAEDLNEKQQVRWNVAAKPEIYRRDAFYPSILAEITPLGLFRDQRIGRVQVFPFRYNPVRGQLQICHRLILQIDFPSSPPRSPAASRSSRTRSQAEQLLADMILNYSQAKPWRLQPATAAPSKAAEGLENAPLCKIVVPEDGLYSVRWKDLTDAGLNLSNIDPQTFQLSNKGRTVPIYAIGEKDGSFDEGDAIEFYGEANMGTYLSEHEDMYQDPYDSRNIYWLSWGLGPGVRMVEEDGGLQAAAPMKPSAYELIVHAEQDNYRDHLNKQFELRDHWFWDSGISAQQLKNYPLSLPHPNRDSPLRPRVSVMLHGLTSSADHDPDHHVLIYLNEHLVADRMWDGQDKLLIDSSDDDFEFTSSAIQDEDNSLTLICPGDTEAGPIDRVLLNWIQVEYPRLYWAEGDVLEFSKPKNSPPGLYQFTLQGFNSSPVRIYKLGSSVVVNGQGEWIKKEGKTHYQLTFQDEVFDDQVRYLAVTSAAKKRIASIELRQISSLKAAGKGADMIIIVHPDFYDRILPLADFRRSQGLEVEVVQVDEVYEQFSDGLFTPQAIRRFLRYAYRYWDPAPLYVLLVGDGSWDYKDRMGLGQNYIPPIMTQTSTWGATPCDNLYACVSGDDQLPDMFIGRLSVQTNNQLDAIVAKIIRAESEPELGDWRRRLLFICGSGTHGPLFRSQSEDLIQKYVPPAYIAERVYAYATNPASDPYYGGTQDLIDALDEGVSFVNYIGHGGGGIWSDAGLMRLEDVDRLRDTRRWPVVASLTCFTAAFDEPLRDCLGERLLRTEDKGVVSFWGASGLGWLYGDYYLDNKLMETIFSGGTRTSGQAVTEAKLQYMASYSGQIAQDLVNEYVLLGDPASRLSFPQKEITLSLQPEAVNPGEVLYIQGSTGQGDQGQAQVTVLDGNHVVLWESLLPVVDGDFQAQAQLPSTFSAGTGTVRSYFWDPQSLADGAGAARFSLSKAFFDSIFTEPRRPTHSDTVHVWADVYAPQGIDSVLCRWRTETLDSTNLMVAQPSPHRYRTTKPIPALTPGLVVRYRVTVIDSSGQRTTSPQQVYQIPSAADLHISQAGISLQGQEEVGIAVEVDNNGETPADSVLVRVMVTTSPMSRMSKEAIIENLPGSSRSSLFLPWDLPAGTYQVVAQADPEDIIPENDEQNNAAEIQVQMNWFNVTPEGGSMTEGQHAPVGSLDGNLVCEIPAGTVSARQILAIHSSPPQIQGQPSLTPARLASGERQAYQLAFLDSAATLLGPAEILLTLRLDARDSLNVDHWDELAIYRWNSVIQRWIRHREISWLTPDSAVATISGLGLYCPMINDDQLPPTIEITVEDQHFAEGALVSSNARIVAVIQDANGIDSQEHTIEVQHNGADAEAEQIVLTPISGKNSLPVSFTPRLPTGRHTVAFSAYDCNGNLATKSVGFQVIDAYGIDRLGNYPNPFEEETVFTYRLTGPTHAQAISLKVYTVSGRLVRGFHDFLDDFGRPGTQLDYHAMVWDGLDEDGNRLANGVYFYKVRAKWEGQTVEEVGKLAILR